MTGKRSSSKRNGVELAREVADLLRLKGYRVRDRSGRGNGASVLTASKDDLIQKNTIRVFCIDESGKVDKDAVIQIASIELEGDNNNEIGSILIVSKAGFTNSAMEVAGRLPNVGLKSLSDLESGLINFAPYVDWYVESYELTDSIFKAADLYHRYVELYCTDGTSRAKQPLTPIANNWLADTRNNILFVLGEYGSGKTSFCRTFTYRLLKEYDGRSFPLPILINLRQYRNSYNIQQMVTDSLVNYYGVSIASFTAIERMCSAGRLLFVLDGFDEMADQSDTRTIAECFRQLFVLAELHAKLLITCRTNFFRSHEEIVDLLKNFKIDSVPTDQSIDFSKHGKIIYVEPLDEVQIAEFVGKRDGGDNLLHEIKSVHDLTDLSSRPVLLDMIVETLPQLRRKGGFVNSAALYEEYTTKWTLRDEWRVVLPKEVRSLFCEEIAWWMHRRGSQALSFKSLEALVAQTFSTLSEHKQDINRFVNDVQTCSFLTRATGTDDFRFAHKSFIEYFVGRAILKSLVSKRNLDEQDVKVDDGKVAFTPWPEQTSLHALLVSQLGVLLKPDVFVARSSWHEELLPRVKKLTAGGGAETLSKSIREMLERRYPQNSSSPLRISEEIATFAMEHALNNGLNIERISTGAEASGQNNVLADLLRLSKSREFAEANLRWLRDASISNKENVLVVGVVVALIRATTGLDFELAKQIKSRISEQAWTYLLYECASEGDRYHAFLRDCFMIPGAPLIDRVICHHGSRASLATSEAELIDERLVEELLDSGSIDEVNVGLQLIGVNSFNVDRAIRLFISLTKHDADVESIVYEALFGGREIKQLIALIRSLLTRNLPAKARSRLRHLERLALDQQSVQHEAKARSPISKDARRELLWRSIRL